MLEGSDPSDKASVFTSWISSVQSSVLGFLASYGWICTFSIILIAYFWPKLQQFIEKLTYNKNAYNYDPKSFQTLLTNQQIAREKMQEKYNADKLKQQQLQKEKLANSSTESTTKPQPSTKTKSLKPDSWFFHFYVIRFLIHLFSAYSPLMGNMSATRYRPTSRKPARGG